MKDVLPPDHTTRCCIITLKNIWNLESHAANTAVKFQIDKTISTPIVVSEADSEASNYSFI